MSDGDETQRYSIEQAGEYVRLATQIEQHARDGLSYDQMVQVAGEVGISEAALRVAIEQAQRETTNDPVPESRVKMVADRCLEILCLKPTPTARHQQPPA